MEIAVSVKNITKKYKLYEDKWGPIKELIMRKAFHKDFLALNNISLDFPKGESIGILGKNGSGKSTLLKIITGIAEPTSGTVKVNGSLVFLDVSSGIDPELSGYENIFLKGTLLGFTKKEILEKVEDIIEFSELGEYIYQPVKTYSSGMRSKLGFAISVHVDPDILIVDEALAVGDAQFRKKCMDKMNEFKRKGKTIIFVSHDKNAVESFCTKAAWIHQGKLIMYGDSKNVASYYNEFMTGRKKLEDIQLEIQYRHGIEKVSYLASKRSFWLELKGYLYKADTAKGSEEFPVELVIRNIRTNQSIRKPIVRIPYEGNQISIDEEGQKQRAGFAVTFSDEEFPSFFYPDKYIFEIRVKTDNNQWIQFPLRTNDPKVIEEVDESAIGSYNYRFKIEDHALYLTIDNHEKLQQQVNKIWYDDHCLNIEGVAFVRGYQTESPDDVDIEFYLIHLENFKETVLSASVEKTEEITENPVFNPQGKIYNYSKFRVTIDLNEVTEGNYECKIAYRMNNEPFHQLLERVWASKTDQYPTEPYHFEDLVAQVQIKSKFLQIQIQKSNEKQEIEQVQET